MKVLKVETLDGQVFHYAKSALGLKRSASNTEFFTAAHRAINSGSLLDGKILKWELVDATP